MSETKFTPMALRVETVETSVGSCHKIGPLPKSPSRNRENFACVYVDGIRLGIDDKTPYAMEMRSYATLFAAAPDLYAACAKRLAELEFLDDPTDAQRAERAELFALLQRARGE